MFGEILKAIRYFIVSFSGLKQLSEAVDKAESPEELDSLVMEVGK